MPHFGSAEGQELDGRAKNWVVFGVWRLPGATRLAFGATFWRSFGPRIGLCLALAAAWCHILAQLRAKNWEVLGAGRLPGATFWLSCGPRIGWCLAFGGCLVPHFGFAKLHVAGLALEIEGGWTRHRNCTLLDSPSRLNIVRLPIKIEPCWTRRKKAVTTIPTAVGAHYAHEKKPCSLGELWLAVAPCAIQLT